MVYSRYIIYKRFVRDLVMYQLSNLSHNLTIVSSSTISLRTSSARDNKIALCARSKRSYFSSYLIVLLAKHYHPLMLSIILAALIKHASSHAID